ncbi:MAG TPA: universal stress protein, partial [Elusimicrobiota bacterium]|nr:universal stress protein [Elusimicrobiota bacterium]
DLLVMGTHGRSGIARLFMGSVTEAVVARSSVPVLALRQPARRIRRVLAPVNFADYSDAGLVYAAALAAALRARLTALYVREAGANDGDPLLRLNERLLRLPGKPALPEAPAAKVRQGHPAAEIAREAVEHDLVVLTAHSKGLLRDALLGTTVERVLRASPAPVLAVPSVGPRRTSPPPLLEAVA